MRDVVETSPPGDASSDHARGPGARIAAAARRALGAAYNGETADSAANATDAATWLDAMRDEDLTDLLDPIGQLGWAELLGERYDDAIRHFGRGIRLARHTGRSYLMPYLLLGQAYGCRVVGQLTEAMRSAESAEDMAHLLNRSDLLGYALSLQASTVAVRDAPELAAPIVERALRPIGTAGRLRGLMIAMLASIRLEQGRPAECVELIRALTDKPQHCGPAHSFRAGWYYTAARAEVDRGRTAEARDWTRRAVEAAG
ncbi:hypothetical protein, partial [Dactylosporangium darangshiense]|uniref:hypothetical protein n=1 Tax=Dactylosporangium darangshiense TaxID=579108 RepID=UPI0031F04682